VTITITNINDARSRLATPYTTAEGTFLTYACGRVDQQYAERSSSMEEIF